MKTEAEVITVNGIEYAPKHTQEAPEHEGMEYVIVRTYSAGVFAGYLKQRTGKEVLLVNARRIWRWEGAATLSQLAVDGTGKPQNCKFPCAVPLITLTEAIEIIPCTQNAKESIEGVPVWKA